MKSSDIHVRSISEEMPQPPITEICLKITYVKFHSNFPGANELMQNYQVYKSLPMSDWCDDDSLFKDFRDAHRAASGQGKIFFKAREKSKNYVKS